MGNFADCTNDFVTGLDRAMMLPVVIANTNTHPTKSGRCAAARFRCDPGHPGEWK
jgi:hypothetical protein